MVRLDRRRLRVTVRQSHCAFPSLSLEPKSVCTEVTVVVGIMYKKWNRGFEVGRRLE